MDAWHTVFLDQDDCYRSNPAHASALEMAVLSRRSSLTSITLLSLSFQILRYKRGVIFDASLVDVVSAGFSHRPRRRDQARTGG